MPKRNLELFKQIEQFIDDYKEANNISPSIREIGAAVGLSKSSVANYLSDMRERGILDYSGFRNITTREEQKYNEKAVRVPVLGVIPCGIPKFAEENIEEYVKLPVSIFGRGDFFILLASGDSMVNAGIDDGDFVVIQKQSDADYGQIVVALVNDEATLKRYHPDKENKRILLHPENDKYEDIVVSKDDEFLIQGVAVKIIKGVH